MAEWLKMVITIVASVLASSGFWAYIQHKSESKDVRSQMLVGLAHDRITHLGLKYIERGWITKDEFENLHDYLYVPYHKMGGNGSAERIMKEVTSLPIRKAPYVEKEE